VPAEDHLRPDVEPWRPEPHERVDSELLLSRPVVARCAECIGAREHTPLVPPKRDFVLADPDEHERRDPLVWQHDAPDSEPLGDRFAVTIVAVEQLQHSGDVLKLVDARIVDGVNEPRAGLRDECVRRALEELVFDPLLYSVHESTQRS
jgi:hypothetical protein